MPSVLRLAPLFVALLLSASVELGAVIALDATTAGNFTALDLGGPSDPVADNQANRVDLELVGRPEDGLDAFYIKFDNFGTPSKTDGELAFRVRLSGDQGQTTVGGNIYVGFDLTGNGAIDYFVAHEGKNDQTISIRRAGTGNNNSPSSLSLGEVLYSTAATSANLNFSSVQSIDPGLAGAGYDPYDLDFTSGKKSKSGPDYFLTFKIDFSELVRVVVNDAENGLIDSSFVAFDQNAALQMLVVTSQNTNNINSDFGGIDDATRDPNLPFNDPGNPGGTTKPIDVTGNPIVPEPAAFALTLGIVFGCLAVFRRRR